MVIFHSYVVSLPKVYIAMKPEEKMLKSVLQHLLGWQQCRKSNLLKQRLLVVPVARGISSESTGASRFARSAGDGTTWSMQGMQGMAHPSTLCDRTKNGAYT